MISSLRRRFITGGMLALLILLTLLIGSIGIVTYIGIERSDSEFMTSVLDRDRAPISSEPSESEQPVPKNGPGRDDRMRSFYLATISADGEPVEIGAHGFWTEEDTASDVLIRRILATGKQQGLLDGQYKYRLKTTEEGGLLVVLDDFLQYRMLLGMLRTAALFALLCLAAMFLILIPVSSRMVRSYVLNAEKQRRFITNAGHELKTPLAIILSNLDAMELIAGENKWSRNIRAQSMRLNSLLHRLLFMARLDERSIQPKREQVPLSELLRGELDAYTEVLEEKHLTLTTDIAELPPLRGHREYLCQLLHVLLDNAVQYVPDGGTVTVRLEQHRKRAQLAITNTLDTLPDCPPETLFERFYRCDSAHDQTGGHGIGLSAARAIAELHGGEISAAYGEHSITFTVELKL